MFSPTKVKEEVQKLTRTYLDKYYVYLNKELINSCLDGKNDLVYTIEKPYLEQFLKEVKDKGDYKVSLLGSSDGKQEINIKWDEPKEKSVESVNSVESEPYRNWNPNMHD